MLNPDTPIEVDADTVIRDLGRQVAEQAIDLAVLRARLEAQATTITNLLDQLHDPAEKDMDRLEGDGRVL